MKYLEEIYGLFVDDPWLALTALAGLLLAGLLAVMGFKTTAGLFLVIVLVIGLALSVRRG